MTDDSSVLPEADEADEATEPVEANADRS